MEQHEAHKAQGVQRIVRPEHATLFRDSFRSGPPPQDRTGAGQHAGWAANATYYG